MFSDSLTTLIQQPVVSVLVWTIVTVVVYLFARKFSAMFNQHPALNPLVITTVLVCIILILVGVPADAYRAYASPLELILAPATAALAVPLFNQLPLILSLGWRVVLPVLLASILAPILGWIVLFTLDSPLNLQMTVLVKSITTPLAMQTSSLIGGIPELAAVIVILTGMVGATLGSFVFALIKVDSTIAQGIALGSVSHVVGTSKAVTVSERCGAFASLSLCLNGIITSLMLPLLF